MANATAILTGQVDFNVRRDVDDQIIAAISQLVEGQATIMATLDDVNAKLGERAEGARRHERRRRGDRAGRQRMDAERLVTQFFRRSAKCHSHPVN
jgi:hypothetical protein